MGSRRVTRLGKSRTRKPSRIGWLSLTHWWKSVDRKSSEGHLVTLEAKRKQLRDSRAQLVEAKRHKAFLLSSSVAEKQDSLDNLATDTQIGILTEKIQSCRKKQRDTGKESRGNSSAGRPD